MDETEKAHAKDLAARGGRQARHAVRNGVKATAVAADAIGEDIEEGAEKVVETGKRLSPAALGFMASETGQGFLGIAVAIAASLFAARKFRGAVETRKAVIR